MLFASHETALNDARQEKSVFACGIALLSHLQDFLRSGAANDSTTVSGAVQISGSKCSKAASPYEGVDARTLLMCFRV